MDEDEDEECLHESSSLNVYLQNLGYSDVQVTNKEAANAGDKFRVCLRKSELPLEVIDKNVMEQVEVITSTKLLFEEDISIVKVLLTNFKVANDGALKIMFQDSFGVIVIFVGLCLYLVIGYYAFLIVSSFYAYKCADYLNRQKFVKVKLRNLVKILKRSSSSLEKSVSFMKADEDRFMLLKVNNTEFGKFEEESVNFYFYNRFRYDFLSRVKKMTSILASATQKLIKGIPLIDLADTPEFYLCNNLDKNVELEDPSKAYLLYLLVQSEFLRRLILSLIPNINLPVKENNRSKLTKILGETIVNLTNVEKSLENRFYFAFHEGLKNECKFKLPETKREPNSEYVEKFASNFHDVSNTFLNLHLKCRLIEESMTCDKFPERVEADLATIQMAVSDCLRDVEGSFVLLKKAKAMSEGPKQEITPRAEANVCNDYEKNINKGLLEKSSNESGNMKERMVRSEGEDIDGGEEKEEEVASDCLKKVQVGYTDLDYVVEDDVFEAHISGEGQSSDLNVDDWGEDEVFKNKIISQISQNVMKELKSRLVEKAENRKKIEMNILKRKGLIQEDDDNEEDEEELIKEERVEDGIKGEEKAEDSRCEEICAGEWESEGNVSFENHLLKNNGYKGTCELWDEMGTQCHYSLGSGRKEFLKKLSETRKSMFTSGIAEEEFCACNSDEETVDDESF